jgi:hypothetical protein
LRRLQEDVAQNKTNNNGDTNNIHNKNNNIISICFTLLSGDNLKNSPLLKTLPTINFFPVTFARRRRTNGAEFQDTIDQFIHEKEEVEENLKLVMQYNASIVLKN